MLASVRKQIDQEGLLLPGETLVVGVSGGTDSSALLHILVTLNQHYHYGWKLHVVHLNHGFRGEESRQDALFVKAYCERLGVFCHLFERNVSLYMQQEGMGAQEAGREIRYQLFRQVAQEVGATKVVLGHHADDQVETILFRLLRGTRLQGLSGIPLRRWLVENEVEVVRPLLLVYRSQLEEYCKRAGIEIREDSSNRSPKYKRNQLRLEVIPLLSTINPRFRQHLLELSAAAKEDDAYLTKLSKMELDQVLVERSPNKAVISRKKFQSCDLALQRRMITLILSYLSSGIEWSSQHVEAVLHIIESGSPSATVHLPKQLVVKRAYDFVQFFTEEQDVPSGLFCYELTVPGTVFIPESGITLRASLLSSAPDWERLSANVVVFDADHLPGKLLVRNRRPGDRLSLFGLQATKKLKELLIESKIPQALRERLPVVVAGEEIVWVPGVRRSAAAVVSKQTERYLYLEVEFGEDWQEVFR